MPQRFCPFAFFSFYVNKNSAEAGGCHHCVEHACALWDSSEQQCGVMSAIESVGTIADNMSNSPTLPKSKKAADSVTTGVSSLFERLRSKKKLPVAEEKTEDETATVVTKPSSVETAETKNTETKSSEAKGSETKAVDVKVDKIINPALIDDVKKEKAVATIKKTPITSSDDVKETRTVVANATKPQIQPAKQLQEQPQAQAKPVSASPTKQNLTEKVKVEPQLEKVAKPLVKTQTSISEDEFDDFSDLLNPPPIDVTDLPIITKKVEKQEDEDV